MDLAPRDKETSSCAKCGVALPAHFIAEICAECALVATAGARHGHMGPYSLEEVIGRGGMGIVYIGVHDKTGRVVAVKVPTLAEESAIELRRRFATEAEVLTALDHPGILPLYEVGEDRGTPFYAMKLADGNLAEALPQLRKAPQQAAAHLAAIAEAVHYAHQRGVLHRDLKPQNILLDEQGQPLVADFGLARLVERDTDVTLGEGLLGTPDYVAPEVAASGPRAATIASDVFSLGAVLYHTLTGEAPFHGGSVIETLSRIAQGQVSPVSEKNPDVPADLALICHKCLEREPRERYASAGALAADLRAWQEGRPLLVRPQTRIERAWQLIRRNPVISVLSTVVLLVIIGGVSSVWISHERALRAERNRADAATRLADDRLVAQCKVEAESLNRSGRAGQRGKAIRLLRDAWAVHPDPEIRSLAIQALSLADFENPADSVRTSVERQSDQAIMGNPLAANGRKIEILSEDGRSLRITNVDGKSFLDAQLAHPVLAYAWNPAGDRLVIATSDKHLHLWKVGDRELERRMTARQSATITLAWHPTRDLVACQTQDGLIRLWDIASGDDWVAGYTPANSSSTFAWSSDGRSLVWSDKSLSVDLPDILRIYRPDSFELRMEDLSTVSFSRDDSRVSVVSESGARVWDLGTGRPVAFFRKFMDEWLGVRWLPHGVLAGGWNSPLREVPLDAVKGDILSTEGAHLDADDGCTLAEISDDGEEWAALLHTHMDRFLLRSMASGQLVSLPHDDPYWISLNGRLAVTSSFRGDSLKVWSLPDGLLEREILFQMSARLDLSPDGKTVLATAGLNIVEIELETGRVVRKIASEEDVRHASYSPDGRWIAVTTARAVQMHDRRTGELVADLTIPTARAGEYQVSSSFSPSGRLLGVQLANSSLAVWDLDEIGRQLAAVGMHW